MEMCIFTRLNNSSSWNLMRGMLQPTGRHVVEQPHPNDFEDMLEKDNIFSGNFGRPMDRPMLTEAPWSMNELRVAIRRAKNKQTGDDSRLVAKLLKHAPEGFSEAQLDDAGCISSCSPYRSNPQSWQTTIFKMLLKSSGAKFASDFRPIGRLRLLYNIFAYPFLGRMEDTLQDSQPGERHSFRKQRGIEEHFLTANLCCKQNWRQTSRCGSFVRRTGDMFGRSGATLERGENKNIDNSITKSERSASSKWTSN